MVRKYFKDDSILLDQSYIRHREELLEGTEEMKTTLVKKKLPKGKDKT